MESNLEVAESSLPERHISDVQKEVRETHSQQLLQKLEPDGAGYANGQDSRYRRDSKRREGLLRGNPFVLALVVALVTTIVVGAAVGGGLGSKLKHVRDRAERLCNEPTYSTITVTVTTPAAAATTTGGLLVNYTAAQPSMVANLDFDCSSTHVNYVTSYEQASEISCQNSVASNGNGSGAGAIVAYTLYECIEACSSLNYWANTPGPCAYIEFLPAMAQNNDSGYTNCWMVGSNVITTTRPQTGPLAGGASAKITVTNGYR